VNGGSTEAAAALDGLQLMLQGKEEMIAAMRTDSVTQVQKTILLCTFCVRVY
jgi:hypothetical protein